MTTKDPVPTLEFGLIPFNPSQEQVVADLNTIFYDKNKKRIVMIIENMVDTRNRHIGVMVTKKTIVHGTNKDPKLLGMEGVASALANVDNVDKMVDNLEQYKEKLSQMRENLKKERGEGQILKRKHKDSLSELEKFRGACHILQSDKDALVLSINITEGEKRVLE